MLFHAGFGWIDGGFAGVDVFFVISGYLITSIIVREQLDGSFTLARFYERRARRILPALLFGAARDDAAALLWLEPNALKDYAHSLIAVLTFSSNFLFMAQAGYFAPGAEADAADPHLEPGGRGAVLHLVPARDAGRLALRRCGAWPGPRSRSRSLRWG